MILDHDAVRGTDSASAIKENFEYSERIKSNEQNAEAPRSPTLIMLIHPLKNLRECIGGCFQGNSI